MPVWLTAFLIGLFISTLVEYWGHRLMHDWLFKREHAMHHKEGWGQGWLKEFKDYMVGTIILIPLGFFISVEFGIGYAVGGVLYGAFAAYSHQLQHEHPELCFWLARPVHYLHHREHMWRKNFGIGLDIWDRVFGTYQKVEFDWSQYKGKRNFWGLLFIKWI